MRLGNVGTSPDGRSVDILITNTTQYAATNPSLNKVNDNGFATINVQTGTNVELSLAFIDSYDDPIESIELECVMLSFYDFDTGKSSVETLMVEGFETYTVSGNTELAIGADDSGRTTFSATARGYGADNPTDPVALTEVQRQRSVALRFEGVASVEMALDISGSTGKLWLEP